MEIRRVQATGGSSYIVTLPKDWVNAQNITKNAPIGLIVQPDGSLLIVPKVTGDVLLEKKVLEVSDDMDSDYLFRLLIGSYMMGYSVIEITSKSRIDSRLRETIVKFSQIAVGVEVVEEGDKSVIIKDLLNPVEMPFDKTVRRSYVLAKSMHEDAVAALAKGDVSMANDVIASDAMVDRLQWLIARQYNIVSREAQIARKMSITKEDAQFYFLVSKVIESVGDQAVIIASKVQTLKAGAAGIKEEISSASKVALEIFKKSVDSWFQRDVGMANEAIESSKELVKLCEKIKNSASKKGYPEGLALNYVAESIGMTGEYSANISELVMDHLIKKI